MSLRPSTVFTRRLEQDIKRMEQRKHDHRPDSLRRRFFEPELQNLTTFFRQLLFARTALEAHLYPALENPVRFRAYQPADFDACVKVYRRNESGRFPEGHEKKFAQYLNGDTKSLIVAEVDGRPVGYGGITLQGPGIMCLCYGIVDPDFQGRRIGTTLTLLRISQVKALAKGTFFVIWAVDASVSFYGRLGFDFTMQWQAENEKTYPGGILYVPATSQEKIKSVLDQRNIRIEGEFSLPTKGGVDCKVVRHPSGSFYLEYTGKRADSPTP